MSGSKICDANNCWWINVSILNGALINFSLIVIFGALKLCTVFLPSSIFASQFTNPHELKIFSYLVPTLSFGSYYEYFQESKCKVTPTFGISCILIPLFIPYTDKQVVYTFCGCDFFCRSQISVNI